MIAEASDTQQRRVLAHSLDVCASLMEALGDDPTELRVLRGEIRRDDLPDEELA